MQFKSLDAIRRHYRGRGSRGTLYHNGAGLVAAWNDELQVYDWFRGDGDSYTQSGSTNELTPDATPIQTPAQQQRQEHRDKGKYAKVNPCYHCGKSAGVDYDSHPKSDTDGWNDIGLCLCHKCAVFLTGLPDDEALRRLTLSSYGSNPQPCK